MKKGFSLSELIISVGLISLVFVVGFSVIKNIDTTNADPYENIRKIISDSVNLYLNTNMGSEEKKELYENGKININSNQLIQEGLLEEKYYVENLNDNVSVANLVIEVILDEEGFLNYSVNIP